MHSSQAANLDDTPDFCTKEGVLSLGVGGENLALRLLFTEGAQIRHYFSHP